MSAHIYHFCQACKQLISPSINDDRLREYDQVASYNKYVDSVQAKRVVSHCCPKCAAPWKPVLLYLGWRSIAKAAKVRTTLDKLLPAGDKRRGPGRYGFTNYKKVQQANGVRQNTTPGFHERMKRLSVR